MKYFKQSDPHSSAVAILGFIIVIIAFGIFTLFNVNQETILSGGSFQSFMALTIVGLGLLVGIFYFAVQSKPKTAKKKRK